MVSIVPCTDADDPTVAQLWNHMAGISESCWHGADTIDAGTIGQMRQSGLVFVLASDGESPRGFAFWRRAGAKLCLQAIAAETAEWYYRLLLACVEWGLAEGLSQGYCEISPRATREMSWMLALEVVALEPVGHDPLAAGADPALRVAQWLRVSTDLHAARQAVLDALAG